MRRPPASSADAPTIGEVVVTAERFGVHPVQTTPGRGVGVQLATMLQSSVRSTASQQFAYADLGSGASRRPPAQFLHTRPASCFAAAGQENSGINFDPGVGVYIDGVYQPRITGAVLRLLRRRPRRSAAGPSARHGSTDATVPAWQPDQARDQEAGLHLALGRRHRLRQLQNATSAPAPTSAARSFDDKVAFSLERRLPPSTAATIDALGLLAASRWTTRIAQAFRGKLLFDPVDKLEDRRMAADYQQDTSDPGHRRARCKVAPAGVDTQCATVRWPRPDPHRTLRSDERQALQNTGGSINATSYPVTPEILTLSLDHPATSNIHSFTEAPLWPTPRRRRPSTGNGSAVIRHGAPPSARTNSQPGIQRDPHLRPCKSRASVWLLLRRKGRRLRGRCPMRRSTASTYPAAPWPPPSSARSPTTSSTI